MLFSTPFRYHLFILRGGGIINKVFLYLYPIKEYASKVNFSDDKESFTLLNECIQKRYRDNGYRVIFALYPDKDMFGIETTQDDKIIYTDITFEDACEVDINGNKKKDFIPKYPNEQLLIEQLGDVDKLVIGGYHFSDCVKRVGEMALSMGINTIVDLELTDLFFSLYMQNYCFDVYSYEPQRYKEYMVNKFKIYGEEFVNRRFNLIYSNPVYGFNDNSYNKKK